MNVLVAERSDFQRNGLKWMLENSGIEMEQYKEVSSTKALFEATQNEQFHLILIEIDMLTPADWSYLAEMSKATIVIGITEQKEFDLAVRCLEVGMYRLFVKPLSIQAMIESIHQAKEEKQTQYMKDLDSGHESESVKKQWISNLIFGQVDHLREVWDQAIQLGYQALPSVVMVGKISHFNELMKNKSDAWKKQVLTEVYSYVKSFCQDHGLISTLLRDEFVILFTPQKGEQKQETIENVKRIGLTLYHWVKKESDHTLQIACGNEYKNPMHLYHSYEEARRLLSLQFYFCQGKVCHYSDYPDLFNKNIIHVLKVPFEEEELSKENIPFIYSEVENQLNLFKEKGIFPVYYKLTLLYVLLKMIKYFERDEQEQYKSFLQQSEKIISSESVDDILSQMKEFLSQISDVSAFSSQHIVIDRALDYIHDNFNQPITLEQVAEEINRSPYYFSHLFRKVMNMTFVEYITQTRIKKAKELLLGDNLTISEISSGIGYQDPNYFSRVFKAICGVSPKQWKTQKKLEKTKNKRTGQIDEILLQKVTDIHNKV